MSLRTADQSVLSHVRSLSYQSKPPATRPRARAVPVPKLTPEVKTSELSDSCQAPPRRPRLRCCWLPVERPERPAAEWSDKLLGFPAVSPAAATRDGMAAPYEERTAT